MRKVIGLLAGAAMLAACGVAASPSQSLEQQLWVGILGPRGQVPSEEMSLEIAGSGWSITPLGGYNGVVTPTASGAVQVTLWGVTTCHRYASFEAVSGSAHMIHFLDDGSVRIDDMAGQALAMGPGLMERALTGCEASASPT